MRKVVALFMSALALIGLLVAGVVLPANAEPSLVGTIGVLESWSEDSNHTGYWETLGVVCYKYEAGDDSIHGEVSDDGKTVVIKPSEEGVIWSLLVVKGGNLSNNVVISPESGVAYASPLNAGGQQSNVSHWFLCGIPVHDPEDADATATSTPWSCFSPGGVSFTKSNAEWDDVTDITDGSRTATATIGHTFSGGLSQKTVTYIAPSPDISLCPTREDSVVITNGEPEFTCSTHTATYTITTVTTTYVWEDGDWVATVGAPVYTEGSRDMTEPEIAEACVIEGSPEKPIYVDTCGAGNGKLSLPENTELWSYSVETVESVLIVTAIAAPESGRHFPAGTEVRWEFAINDEDCPTTTLALTGAGLPVLAGGVAVLFILFGVIIIAAIKRHEITLNNQ